MSTTLNRFYYDIENKKHINLIGTKISERSFLLKNKSFLYIALDNVSAMNMQKQMQSLDNKCAILTTPLDDVVYSDINAINIMNILSQIASKEVQSLIVTYNFLLQRIPPLDMVKSHILPINIGDEIPLQDLTTKLINLGYKRKDILENVGDFTIKGDIVDIYLPDKAVRLDLGFDVLEYITEISLETNKSYKKLDSLSIYPITMFLQGEEGTKPYYNLPMTKYISDNITDYFDLIIIDEPTIVINRLEELYQTSRQNILSQIEIIHCSYLL